MSSKDNILQRLRANTRETYDKPSLDDLNPIAYADPVEEFKTKTTTIAGARLIEAQPGDSLNQLVRQAYPDARIVANLPDIDAQLNPDTVEQAQELEKPMWAWCREALAWPRTHASGFRRP